MLQKVLTLEVWDSRVAVAQLQRSWGGMRLMDWLVVDLPPEVKDVGKIARYTAERLQEAGLSGHRVVLGLGPNRAHLQKLDFPFSSRQKIERALPGEMETSLSMNSEEFLFDAYLLGETPEGMYRVLAAALPRSTIEQWSRALRDFGLEPERIDLVPSSLAELGAQIPAENGDGCTVVWQLGRTRSTVVFLRNGRLEHTDGFWTGTEDLARVLADRTGSSREEAREGIEQGKYFQPVSETEETSSCAQGQVVSECSRIALDELMRTFRRFQEESPNARVEKIVLTDKGSRWKGLATTIAVQSRLPLTVAQNASLPFETGQVDKNEMPEVASAACLALKVRKRASGWNFRKKDAAGGHNRGWRRFALDIGVGMGIVLLCAVISFSFHIWLKNQDLHGGQNRAGHFLNPQQNTVSEASTSLGTAQYLSVIQERISALREQVGKSSVKEKGSDLADLLVTFGMSSSHGENTDERKAHWANNKENLSENNLNP